MSATAIPVDNRSEINEIGGGNIGTADYMQFIVSLHVPMWKILYSKTYNAS